MTKDRRNMGEEISNVVEGLEKYSHYLNFQIEYLKLMESAGASTTSTRTVINVFEDNKIKLYEFLPESFRGRLFEEEFQRRRT